LLPPAGRIDFARLADLAATFKPALIICGGSAYPREWEYKRFREIADANGGYCHYRSWSTATQAARAALL
jgi:glycine/serine hydroxymethyltransferase